ncbi:unnamed protein product [Dovyalis caffra]|uniref:RNase III domain-containing protein n=1 Tax=Dovyalis caffra TaxID=77055 RepID=A0AAV1SW65_9ROSI|nr:unnamed protein product [Dovyalis caffra]
MSYPIGRANGNNSIHEYEYGYGVEKGDSKSCFSGHPTKTILQSQCSKNPFKNLNPKPNPTPPTPPTATTSSPTVTLTAQNVSELLKRKTVVVQEQLDDSYLGYERWLPSPPKVEKPRSVFNAATLAYIGDSIFELYARRHFLFPPLSIEEHNDCVMAVVRCEAQDALLQKLLNDNCLSEEESGVLRWGKNIGSSKTRTKKRAGVAAYNRASSLETLVDKQDSESIKERLESLWSHVAARGSGWLNPVGPNYWKLAKPNHVYNMGLVPSLPSADVRERVVLQGLHITVVQQVESSNCGD